MFSVKPYRPCHKQALSLSRDPSASVGLPSSVSPVLLCKRFRRLEWSPLPLLPLLIWSLLQIISGYDSCYIPAMEWVTHSPLCASVSTSMRISLRIPSEYTVKCPQTLSRWFIFSLGEGLEPGSSLCPLALTQSHTVVLRTSMAGACNPGTSNCSARESEAG